MYKYTQPKVLKVGDTREYCIQEEGESSQVFFGIVLEIHKDSRTAKFEKVFNTGQVKKGKKNTTTHWGIP